MTIWTDAQCKAALRRIAELAGCLEDTPEEDELIALQRAGEVWEKRSAAAQ